MKHWLKGLSVGLIVALFLTGGVGLYRSVSAGGRQGPLAYPLPGPFIGIQVDSKENHQPAVAYSGERAEYLVVWTTHQDAFTWDIWARRVGSDGILKGPSEFPVATSAGKKRWEPAVAYNPVHDEYLIVYTYEFDDLDSDYDIKATVVDGDLSWKTSEYSIYSPAGIQWTPQVAYNSEDDEYLVVWGNVWGDDRHDIYAQRLEGDGSLLPGPVTIASHATEPRSIPDVAYNATRNEYLIAYNYSPSLITTESNIYGKVASANLGWMSPSDIHICDNTRDQGSLAVAAGPDEYLVAWTDENTGTSQYDVFARRLSGDGGTPLGPSDGFPIAQFPSASSYLPDVDYGRIYGYLVTWYSDQPSYLDEVYGNYVLSGRDEVSALPFGVNGGMGSSQRTPAIACTPIGECLVVSEDNLDWPTWTPKDYEIRGSFILPWRIQLPIVLRNF